MRPESGPWLARLALCLLCLGHATGQQPSTTTSPTAPPPIRCKTNFLRTYLLKGLSTANSTQPFLICPAIKNNCCSRRDQLYIFHYLKTVLPAHLESVKMRRDSAFQKLRALHRRLMRTSPDYSKVGLEKGKFCMGEWRKLSACGMDKFVQEYITMSDGWIQRREKTLSSFYCSLCDGANQEFLNEVTPTVVIGQATCTDFIQNFQVEIRFWLSKFMDFMVTFQNVVDCNHYTGSYNLTFFAPEKLDERVTGLACLRSVGGPLTPACRKLCSTMGLASLTSWVDGDSSFMEEAVNFFDKSNFNQETGRFISMEMRHYFRRFQPIKQLNQTEQGVFRNIVRQSLTPVIQNLNAVEVGMAMLPPPPPNLDVRLLRDRAVSRRERRLSNKPPMPAQVWNPMALDPAYHVFRPSNRNSEPLKGAYVATANAEFEKDLERSPLLLNRRRLQTATTAAPTPPIRPPRTDIPLDDQLTYDQIAIEPRDQRLTYVFAVQVVPLNIDRLNKTLSGDGGLRTEYMMMDLEMSPQSFQHMVYAARPPDPFIVKIDELVVSLPMGVRKTIFTLLDTDFSVPPTVYFAGAIVDVPERKLHLRGVTAAQLLKEITAKR